MNRSVVTLAALLLAAAPAGAANRSFAVPGFAKLKLEGPYSLRVHTGVRASVVAHGPQARLDKILVEMRDGALVISTEKGWSWGYNSWSSKDAVVVDVTVPMLEAATLTGSGDINIDRIRTTAFLAQVTGSGDLTITRLDSSRLVAGMSGSGDLTVAGRTGRADMTASGSGDVSATGLAVDLLAVSLTGSGDISVGPTRVARANLVGSGDINIGGRPRCTTTKQGSGDIRCGR